MYGVRLHPAKDREGTKLSLAVAHTGVLVFQVEPVKNLSCIYPTSKDDPRIRLLKAVVLVSNQLIVLHEGFSVFKLGFWSCGKGQKYPLVTKKSFKWEFLSKPHNVNANKTPKNDTEIFCFYIILYSK